jgi:hypothetical protein
MAIDRRDARNLSADGAKVGAIVLGGRLVKEGDRYVINKTDITALLDELVEQNIVLVFGQVAEQDKNSIVHTCLTCGREYTSSECPHCANVRSRLRGER